jgi:uncharacterized protein with HEPN domain
VAHDYLNIDSGIVFDICTKELEPLLKTVKQIIDDLEEKT